eukprot:257192_1
MAEPALLEGTSGICYGASKLDQELAFLNFNASLFEDYAETLKAEYFKDFQSYASDMYDTVSGLWRAINDIDSSFSGEGDDLRMFDKLTFDLNDQYNYSDNTDYNLNFGFDRFTSPGFDTGNASKKFEGFVYLD